MQESNVRYWSFARQAVGLGSIKDVAEAYRGMQMKKSKFAAAVLLSAAIAYSPVPSFAQAAPPAAVWGHTTPWWLFICPAGVVSAAVVKNAKRKKELTREEAWTCGFLYWYNEGTGKYGKL